MKFNEENLGILRRKLEATLYGEMDDEFGYVMYILKKTDKGDTADNATLLSNVMFDSQIEITIRILLDRVSHQLGFEVTKENLPSLLETLTKIQELTDEKLH